MRNIILFFTMAVSVSAAASETNESLKKECFTKHKAMSCFQLAVNKEKQGSHAEALAAIGAACDHGATDACDILEKLHANEMAQQQVALESRRQAAIEDSRDRDLRQVRDAIAIKEYSDIQNARAQDGMRSAADGISRIMMSH